MMVENELEDERLESFQFQLLKPKSMVVPFAHLRPTVSNRFMVHGFYYARHHPFSMNGPEDRFFIKTSFGSAKLFLQHSESLAIDVPLE